MKADVKPLSVLDAMDDIQIFAPMFDAPSWAIWRVCLKAIFGLPLSEAELLIFQKYTGRQVSQATAAREAWLVVGRRGGKSRIAALVAVVLATLRDYLKILAPGEVGTVMVIASDRKQARVVFGYIKALLTHTHILAPLIADQTKESIILKNSVTIEVHTASFRAVRGYTIIAAICDEIAYWSVEDAADPDTEILNGIRPGMATVPGALLLCISSPYARRGALWEAYKTHFGQNDDPVLVWQSDTRSMNPTVDEKVIADAYAQDEVAASAEYGAQFRRDIEGFISKEAVDLCTVPGRLELPPVANVEYVGFCDPSGGASDSMTLAIAHHEKGKAVLDLVRECRAPFSPENVVKEFAGVLETYGLAVLHGDFYSGQWCGERFRTEGIDYQVADKSKSELYRELLPSLNSGRVELLDHPRLIAQLSSLERRTARGGKDSIDHGPRSHDDVINAAAGALVQVAGGDDAGLEQLERAKADLTAAQEHLRIVSATRPLQVREWEAAQAAVAEAERKYHEIGRGRLERIGVFF